jgi:hypothetical protein
MIAAGGADGSHTRRPTIVQRAKVATRTASVVAGKV